MPNVLLYVCTTTVPPFDVNSIGCYPLYAMLLSTVKFVNSILYNPELYELIKKAQFEIPQPISLTCNSEVYLLMKLRPLS